MKVVQINSVCASGSTGKICASVSGILTEKGIENYILYAYGESDFPAAQKYMSSNEIKTEALKAKLSGNYGFQSKSATRRLTALLDSISPDIVQLHNLHSHNVNLEELFRYFKQRRTKLAWTFHDCWAFTGYCMYYDLVNCEKWKTRCGSCPVRKHYSWIFDNSGSLHQKKKELFSGLDLTIVTPSQWLAQQVGQSFLSGYDVRVIYNGIDLSAFRPIDSDFRKDRGLEDKFVILGVAFVWEKRKGIDAFIALSKRLDPKRYTVVLVGTNDALDKELPEQIVKIHQTKNQQELAQIYSAADVFVNPTREDNFPTVNIEALACGTPVITFRTGGSPECMDEASGVVVDCNDIDALVRETERVCLQKPFSRSDCVRRAKAFDRNERYSEYVKLYLSYSDSAEGDSRFDD